jgi:predicted dehydrogenase
MQRDQVSLIKVSQSGRQRSSHLTKNVVVVGGGIGSSHIRGYAAHPDKFRVLGICDLNDERLAAISEEFGLERQIRDFDQVLAMNDVDIVDICTPPSLHRDQMLAALAAGKDVVCEKPIVGSLKDVDIIIAAEQKARGRVLPVFQYRFGNGVQKAKYLIDQGLAGRPYLATAETFWRRTAAYYDNPWRGRWETELGGVLVSQAIHIHDLLTYLMGPVSSVFARLTTRVNTIEVEDCAVASLAMESGALASIAATLGSQNEISRLRLAFEHITFESSQTPYALGDDPWQIVTASADVQQRIHAALQDWAFVPSGFEGLFGAYHNALVTDQELPVTLSDARRSFEMLTALYHSSRTGDLETMPIRPGHPLYASWVPAS